MDKFKEKIDEIVKKVKEDKGFAKRFKDDPVKAVESVIGIDLPDDKIKSIVDGVKAKLTGDKISSEASNLVDKVKDLF